MDSDTAAPRASTGRDVPQTELETPSEAAAGTASAGPAREPSRGRRPSGAGGVAEEGGGGSGGPAPSEASDSGDADGDPIPVASGFKLPSWRDCWREVAGLAAFVAEVEACNEYAQLMVLDVGINLAPDWPVAKRSAMALFCHHLLQQSVDELCEREEPEDATAAGGSDTGGDGGGGSGATGDGQGGDVTVVDTTADLSSADVATLEESGDLTIAPEGFQKHAFTAAEVATWSKLHSDISLLVRAAIMWAARHVRYAAVMKEGLLSQLPDGCSAKLARGETLHAEDADAEDYDNFWIAALEVVSATLVVRYFIDLIENTVSSTTDEDEQRRAALVIAEDVTLAAAAVIMDDAVDVLLELLPRVAGGPTRKVLHGILVGLPDEQAEDPLSRSQRRVPRLARRIAESEASSDEYYSYLRAEMVLSITLRGMEFVDSLPDDPKFAQHRHYMRAVREYSIHKVSAVAEAKEEWWEADHKQRQTTEPADYMVSMYGSRARDEHKKGDPAVKNGIKSLWKFVKEVKRDLDPVFAAERSKFLRVKQNFEDNFAAETAASAPPIGPPPHLLAIALSDDERIAVAQVYRSLLRVFRYPGDTSYTRLDYRMEECFFSDDGHELCSSARQAILYRHAVESALEAQRKHEKEVFGDEATDVDKISAAFEELEAQYIICRHNADNTLSGTHSTMRETVQQLVENEQLDAAQVVGYCAYHSQDVDRVLGTGSLSFVFSGWNMEKENDCTDAESVIVGEAMVAAFSSRGLAVKWDGDPAKRVEIVALPWRRRLPPSERAALLENMPPLPEQADEGDTGDAAI